MQINVLMFNQDDPKKCTAAKLVRFGLAKKITTLRSKTALLHPFAADTLLNSEKHKFYSITAIDCSWNKAPETFSRLRLMGLEPRSLPSVIPANPVNSGKVGKLTTAEAIASALLICKQYEQADKVMSVFKWGPAFIKINSSIL